jgi:putative SbcD/Mre11-related phosphoesterase
MKLTEDIELIEGMPIAYIKSINAIVVSDLHLGYEGVMSKRGALIPKVNFRKIKDMIKSAAEATKAGSIIVDGDIKNEFSNVDVEEFNELYDFINFAKEIKIRPILIKGNHDNFVERYSIPFKLAVHRQQATIGKYLFFHGEELPKIESKGTTTLIMGHEHPAIGIYYENGRKEKIKCFLYGKYKGRRLLVLPAMSYFAGGTEINLESRKSLLSPIFKKIDIDEMHAIVVGYGSTMDFGKISELRKMTAQ